MEVITAICILHGLISGTVDFKYDGRTTNVTGLVYNLTPNSKHGFHIHQYGDTSNGCSSMGGHYNPHGMMHGAPNAEERHAGDLGNIQADENGASMIDIRDKQIPLSGRFSILGRGCIVHALEDDLGKGGHDDSLTTGHAGTRLACGVIALKKE